MAKIRVVKSDDHDDDSIFDDAEGQVDEGHLRVLRIKEEKDQYEFMRTTQTLLGYYPKGSYRYFETVE